MYILILHGHGHGIVTGYCYMESKKKTIPTKKTLFGTKSKTDQGCLKNYIALKNYIVLKNYIICIKLIKRSLSFKTI